MDGMRCCKTVNGTTITHIWVGGQIVADVTGNYTATCYVHGTNLLAQYEFNYGASDDYTYYLQNAHGDVTALLDTAGELTKSYVYDAFGVEQNIDDSDSNAFRYCGEYYDAETGTVYLRARYYNPVIGRFISRDTYTGEHGAPLSLNLYTYCHNNPVISVDPSGHFILTAIVVGAISGAVVSAGVSLYNESKSAGGISNVTSENWLNVGISFGIGGLCGAVGGAAGAMASAAVGTLATASAASPLVASSISNTLSYSIGTGMAGGMAGSWASTVTKQSICGYYDPTEIMWNTTVGGVFGAAFGGLSFKLTHPTQNNSAGFLKINSQTGRNGSLPAKGGEPDSRTNLYNANGELTQSRIYDQFGNAYLDVDYAHSNGDNSHVFPHIHEWDWTQLHPRQ